MDENEDSNKKWLLLLCNAVENDNLEEVECMLEQQRLSQCANETGDYFKTKSPLHAAVLQNKPDMVELLLRYNADVEVTNLYGESPLHLACRVGNTNIVEKLLANGSGLNCKDCGESTPLFHAVYSGQQQVAQLLIKDLDTYNEELMTPLDFAVSYNNSAMVSLLSKGGSSPEKSMGAVYYPGHYSNSILFSLLSNNDSDNISVLIDAGYQLKNSHLNTMIRVAKKLNWDDSLLKDVECMIRDPLSLKNCSRIVIRRHLMKLNYERQRPLQILIPDLPLPTALRKYVSMM